MYIYKLSLGTILIAIVALQKSIAMDETKIQWIQQQIVAEIAQSTETDHTHFLEAIRQLDSLTQGKFSKNIFERLPSDFANQYSLYNQGIEIDSEHNNYYSFSHLPALSVLEHSYTDSVSGTDTREKIASDNRRLRV